MNLNCENCAAAPECPTACDYGSVFCTMKRLQRGQTKGKAANGVSLKDADDLRRYRAIGPPSDLIRPVRCGECEYQQSCFMAGSGVYGDDDFCSKGERMCGDE